MKTLYLEKRGCDFFNDEPATSISNVGNYRVGSYDYSIHGKDGKDYIMEFSLWRNRSIKRYTNKRTGKPLKHPITEVINPFALNVKTMYDADGLSYGNSKLESVISERNYTYTLENIMTVVNEISKDVYTAIEFVD